MSAISDKLLKVTFRQNMKLFLCTLASNPQHSSRDVYYCSRAKLTSTPVKQQVKRSCIPPPKRWGKSRTHKRTPELGRVHVIKGNFYYLSTDRVCCFIYEILLKNPPLHLSKGSSLIVLHGPDSPAALPVSLHGGTRRRSGPKMMNSLSESGEQNRWTNDALAIMTQHRPDLHLVCK